MVYSVLADYTILSQLYAVLFNLLDSLTLRHVVSALARAVVPC